MATKKLQIVGDLGFVSHNEQSLTDEQKAQARINIGAIGDTAVSEQISDAIENSVADWSQTDETAADYIKNKPDEEDALSLVADMNLVSPITAEDGSIYTDENGAIYSL